MKKKIMIFVMAITMTASLMVSVSAKTSGNVTASGSSALLPIVKQAATDFIKKNTNVNIQVSGGGSGTGLQQAKDGVVNIGNSDVFAPEGSGLVDHQVCIEPFLFVTNSDVLVSSLTQTQIIGIFSGKIKNWKEVGGKDQKIAVIMRQASSGTRMTIQSIVMGNEQFTTNAVVQESAGAVRNTIIRTPGSIGYLDLAYVSPYTRTIKYNGVAPTIENVKNGTYKLNSVGHMYTKGEATGSVKAFIEYIQSKEFQSTVIPNFKFVPVADIKTLNVKKIQIGDKNTKKPVVKKLVVKKSTVKKPVTKKK